MNPFVFYAALEATGNTTALSTLLGLIGTVFTALVGWMASTASAITAQPLLLFGYLIGFAFAGVGLFKSLAHR